MSSVKSAKIATTIFAALGAVTAGVSCALSGIEAGNVQASDRNTLLASSALTGFGTIILIVAFLILARYHSKGGYPKGLLITFWIMAAVYIIMIIIAGVLNGVIGNKVANAAHKNTLIASAVLPVFSLIFFIIAYVVAARSAGVSVSINAPSFRYLGPRYTK